MLLPEGGNPCNSGKTGETAPSDRQARAEARWRWSQSGIWRRHRERVTLANSQREPLFVCRREDWPAASAVASEYLRVARFRISVGGEVPGAPQTPRFLIRRVAMRRVIRRRSAGREQERVPGGVVQSSSSSSSSSMPSNCSRSVAVASMRRKLRVAFGTGWRRVGRRQRWLRSTCCKNWIN